MLTGTVRRSSKRSLIDRGAVSGRVPCSGASGAGTRCSTQSAPRSRRRSRRERLSSAAAVECPRRVAKLHGGLLQRLVGRRNTRVLLRFSLFFQFFRKQSVSGSPDIPPGTLSANTLQSGKYSLCSGHD